ncbi:MAG: hypothetical protein QNK04_01830 [Myxococcota bacterium]|nr:hypothetical protein [Myxococcota bacterium]
MRQIPTSYERVKEFPYRGVGTSRLGSLIDALPDGTERVYNGQTL